MAHSQVWTATRTPFEHKRSEFYESVNTQSKQLKCGRPIARGNLSNTASFVVVRTGACNHNNSSVDSQTHEGTFQTQSFVVVRELA